LSIQSYHQLQNTSHCKKREKDRQYVLY
jgi:hypothetical protein